MQTIIPLNLTSDEVDLIVRIFDSIVMEGRDTDGAGQITKSALLIPEGSYEVPINPAEGVLYESLFHKIMKLKP